MVEQDKVEGLADLSRACLRYVARISNVKPKLTKARPAPTGLDDEETLTDAVRGASFSLCLLHFNSIK